MKKCSLILYVRLALIFITAVIGIYWIYISISEEKSTNNETAPEPIPVLNDIIRKEGVLLIYPHFTKIDLVCDSMPSPNDLSVILIAEAAYTGKFLTSFRHTNIAGDHVSSGVRYRGYKCKRNTGAFVYYNNQWKFLYEQYNHELDSAAYYKGTAFAQELIMLNGELLPTHRKDSSKNIFRALCEESGRLCIAESNSITTFAHFKKNLIDANIANAIYLDMGNGWNHAWYREGKDIIELHPKTHTYCTNWITFYK